MDQEEKDECKIGLGLGIGGGGHVVDSYRPPLQFHILFPPRPLPLSGKQEEDADCTKNSKRSRSVEEVEESVVQESGGSEISRKKLRLSKEQTTVLEDTFRDHNTLTGIQKQELADKLNLRPRQVEVWFQNRRARSKLKQTEVDFQLLKKWCDSLNEENRRLRNELQELKLVKQPESSTKVTSVAPAALTVCTSCGRTMTSGTKIKADGDFSMAC